jgi:hypothetical protein
MAGGSWVSALFLVLGLVIVNPAPSAAPGSVRGGGNAVPLARSSSPSQGGASGGQRLFACGARVALGAVARDAEDYEAVAENLPGERDQQQAVGVGGGAHMAFVVPCSTAPGYPLRGIRGCASQRMPTAPGAFAASDGGFFQSANGHLEAPPTDWSRASVVQSESASGAGTGVVGGSESRGNKMASGGSNSTSAVFAPLVNHLGMLQKVGGGGGGAEARSMEELVRRIRVGGQEASRQAGPCHVPRLSPSKFTGGRSFSEAQHVSPGVTVVERLRGLSGRFELAKAMYLEEETDGEAREGQEVRRGRNREVRASRRPTFDGARTVMSGMAGGHVAASACGHSVVAFDRRRGSEQEEEEEEEKREREKSVGHGRGVWHAERAEDAPLVKPTSDEWLQDGDASHRRLIPCVVSVLESMSSASSSGGSSSSSRGRSRSRSGSGSGSGTARPKSSFHALRKPKVSLMDYVGRIAKYAGCSSGCFVAAVVYMDRVLQRDGAHIEWENVHRLLLSCMLVAAKISDDVHYSNAFWAKIGGVANSELNELEMKVMSSLGWSAHISKREFDVYANGLASLRGEGMSSSGARIKGRKILAAIHGMEEAASLEGRVAVHLPDSFPNDGDAENVQGDDEARKDAGIYRDSAGVAAHDASPDSLLSVAA